MASLSKAQLEHILSECLPAVGCYEAANNLSDLAQIDCIVVMTVAEWKKLSPKTYAANKANR